MSRYRLMPRDGSIPYQKILTGRSWVGRVVRHATEPHYVGTMYRGRYSATGPTAVAAFEAVVARALGYDSADALHRHNADVRQVRRAMTQAGDHLLREVARGNFAPLDRALETPQGATVAMRAMSRSLFGKRRRR